MAQRFCLSQGMKDGNAWMICLGVLLLGGLFSVISFFARKKWPMEIPGGKLLWILLEIIFFLAILCLGVMLRLRQLPFAKTGEIYELVTMKYGVAFPNAYVGAKDWYLRILHGICFLLGNTTYFCIRFHLALTVAAGIVCYFGVRAMTSAMPAIVFSAFYFLSPSMVKSAVTLSPEPFSALLLGLGMLGLGLWLRRKRDFWLFSVILGILLGAIGFGTTIGFSMLAVVLLDIMTVDGDRYESNVTWLISVAITFGTTLMSFLGCIGIQASSSGRTYSQIIVSWMEGASGKGKFTVPSFFGGDFGGIEGVILATLLVTMLICFFLKGDGEKEGIAAWAVLVLIAVLGAIFGLETKLLYFSSLFVAAGMGVQSLFLKNLPQKEKAEPENTEKEVKEEKEEKPEAQKSGPEKMQETKAEEKKTEEVKAEGPKTDERKTEADKDETAKAEEGNSEEVNAGEGKEEGKSAERPPVQKKENASESDYDYEVSEKDDYDV